MAIKNAEGKWICSYCRKEYSTPALADTCRDEHDIIYVPLGREDLNRLINFLFIQDPKLMRETIVRALQTALSNSQKKVDKV